MAKPNGNKPASTDTVSAPPGNAEGAPPNLDLLAGATPPVDTAKADAGQGGQANDAPASDAPPVDPEKAADAVDELHALLTEGPDKTDVVDLADEPESDAHADYFTGLLVKLEEQARTAVTAEAHAALSAAHTALAAARSKIAAAVEHAEGKVREFLDDLHDYL